MQYPSRKPQPIEGITHVHYMARRGAQVLINCGDDPYLRDVTTIKRIGDVWHINRQRIDDATFFSNGGMFIIIPLIGEPYELS